MEGYPSGEEIRSASYSVENSETVPYGDIILINAIDGSVIDGSENEVITNYNQIKEEDRITPMNKMF